jgi:hypothetical protein
MHQRTIRSLCSIAAVVTAFCFARPAFGQCTSSFVVGFSNIAPVPNNPFQAERATTRPGFTSALAESSFLHPQLIARDSQGRVRIDRALGKFKVVSGSDEGAQIEQHSIQICDPTTRTTIEINDVAKTAVIYRSPQGRLPPNLEGRSLCAALHRRLFGTTEDLGNQLINGIDAQGVRTTREFPATINGTATTTTSVQEQWCSDDLGAVLLEVSYNNQSKYRMETALTKIVRQEPDPSLFEIPAGYTVTERIPEALHPRALGPLQPAQQSPSNPAPQP